MNLLLYVLAIVVFGVFLAVYLPLMALVQCFQWVDDRLTRMLDELWEGL